MVRNASCAGYRNFTVVWTRGKAAERLCLHPRYLVPRQRRPTAPLPASSSGRDDDTQRAAFGPPFCCPAGGEAVDQGLPGSGPGRAVGFWPWRAKSAMRARKSFRCCRL